MADSVIGVIGGSGLYDMEGLADVRTERIDTPFGDPSDEYVIGVLGGKTVAFLWDYLFRGDEIFPILESELSAAYPGINFVGYSTFGSTHGAEEGRILADLPATLAEHKVDAIVSGMGC